MNINRLKPVFVGLLLLLCVQFVSAQQDTKVVENEKKIEIRGLVLDAVTKNPLIGAKILTTQTNRSIISDSLGQFSVKIRSRKAILTISALGYLERTIVVAERSAWTIYLLPEKTYLEAQEYNIGGQNIKLVEDAGTARGLRHLDLNRGYNSPEEGLFGKIAGLRMISKGGLPNEGAAPYFRGIRSFVGTNTPLIVVDGMPYFASTDVSEAISGFSRNMFLGVNMKEVGNITFLKGADAASYGSMGANGVIYIETEQANDMETKVEFHTIEGVSFLKKRIPLLKSTDSKSYLADIGENKYADPAELLSKLPFLVDDPNNPTNYLYNHETNWQDEIFKPAITSENMFKVKGGDAVAKYTLSIGTQQNNGVVDNTHFGKYYTRLNASINFSQKLTAHMGAALNYNNYSNIQEQGMVSKTNPYLAALYQAPFMSVYRQAYNQDGELKDLPFYNPVQSELKLSNPVAIVNDLEAKSKSYNVSIELGLKYKFSNRFSADGQFGIFYAYAKDDIFIPGKNYHSIAALRDSLAINTVRSSVNEQLNYFGRFSLIYDRTYNEWHNMKLSGGMQFLTSRTEYDAAEGANTPTDFYTMLNSVTEGKLVYGDLEKWSWMNFNLNAGYEYQKQLIANLGVTLDGSSAYGQNSGRWFLFPYLKTAWRISESKYLTHLSWLSNLALRAEVSLNGNSRFSSKYGKYYYESVLYKTSAGIVRNGLPNTKIGPEKVLNENFGFDFAIFGNRLNMSVDLYREHTFDMLITNRQAAYTGYAYRYDNAAEMRTNGVEFNVRMNLLNKSGWNWMVGGTVAHHGSKILSLGNENSRKIEYSDGTVLLVEKDRSPYLFYGKKAVKVFSTTQEANNAALKMQSGTRFVAGDVMFLDKNGDKYINEDDNMVIGDPTPDVYGGFYTNLTYKNWNLYLNFVYSYGNDVYNAVRRSLGAMKDFSNQDHSVQRRWMVEGQNTDIPRASYGDPHGNSRFSSRWIEDGSFTKLKEATLSYERNKKTWLFNSIRVYLMGENLLCFTKYLGVDPEFSYSYDPALLGMDLGKIPLQKSVKLGLILNF